jgi:hypothetical protein
MSLITYFKAAFHCPRCGRDSTAWVSSKLGSLGATYSVGDCPGADIPLVDFEDTSLRVRPPAANEPIRVLMSWNCEHCKLASFAEVAFFEGCVRAIDLVDLDPATLGRIHYIAESLDDMLETIIGERLYDGAGLRADWLERLRDALDAGKRW